MICLSYSFDLRALFAKPLYSTPFGSRPGSALPAISFRRSAGSKKPFFAAEFPAFPKFRNQMGDHFQRGRLGRKATLKQRKGERWS
jgi:hypothetical protein